jgi:hypothetical protein
MKKLFLFIFIILLFGCSPIEEGVYFEINGKPYQTADNLEYGYAAGNTVIPGNPPMYFFVTYENDDFHFNLTTYNFHKGKHYFNNWVENFGDREVKMEIQIKNDQLAETGTYFVDPNTIGTSNYIEIINFQDHLAEIRFYAHLLKDNKVLDLKNGYLKVNI